MMRWLAVLLLIGCETPAMGTDAAVSDTGPRIDAARVIDAGGDAPAIDVPIDARAAIDTGPVIAMRPVIVAAGSNHARWLSIDEGLTWCDVRDVVPSTTDFDNPNLLRNITYANGRFVTGSWTAIFSSTNGYEWTDVTAGAGPAFHQWVAQIDYGNGWWVATGGYGQAMRSHDLTTWEVTSSSLGGTQASRELAFGAGMFVTARDSVGWWSSADGTGWTQLDATAGTGVRFENGMFVAPPDYDHGRGIRLSNGWPHDIRRSDDVDGATFTRVATLDETPLHFAFGEAPAADYAPGRVPSALASCLGL